MLRQFTLKLTLLMFGSDLLLTLLAVYLAKVLRLTLSYGIDLEAPHLKFPWILYPIVALIWVIVFVILPVYDARKTYRAIDQLQVTATAVGFATLIFAGVAYFFFRDLSRFLFLYFFVLDLLFLLGYRIILRVFFRLSRSGWPGDRTRLLILGAGRVGQRLAGLLQDYAAYGVEVVGFLDDDLTKANQLQGNKPFLGGLDRAVAVVQSQQVDEVIMALPLDAHEQLVKTVRELQGLAVNVRVVPDLFDLAFVKTRIEDFEGVPLISLREPILDPFQQAVKRSFDLVIGLISLFLALPAMVVIAVLIKLDSVGPIFYNHQRVGQNGRIFTMYKFRSMVADAEARREEVMGYNENGKVIFKRPNDPRITRIGHFIRRTSLDEMPQLINVIKGDMSLVGPRPELPWLVDLYEPWQHRRFSVPQGITGWWQVNGRGDKPMHLHVEEDLYYIQNYSLFLDILILWRTLSAVVKRSGAF